jgi:hypothetical protein
MNQQPNNNTNNTNNNTMTSSFYPVSMDDSRIVNHDIDSNVLDGIAAVIKTTKKGESCTWTYLRDNPPSESTGYMFSNNPAFSAIMNHMEVGHSGSSYAWTMRNLQYIATHGIDAYIAAACAPKQSSSGTQDV